MLAVVDVAESAGVSVEGSSQRVGITRGGSKTLILSQLS